MVYISIFYIEYFFEVNCKVSRWSSWTECDKICGSGTQGRSRSILEESAHGGHACPSQKDLTESQPCNTDPCPGKLY